MEIHSSSLRVPPVRVGTSQPVSRVDNVLNNMTGDDSKHIAKRQIVNTTRSTAEIEQVILRTGFNFSNETNLKDVLSGPVPTNIQYALDAYQNQRSQPFKNQRTELLSGIDFYV